VVETRHGTSLQIEQIIPKHDAVSGLFGIFATIKNGFCYEENKHPFDLLLPLGPGRLPEEKRPAVSWRL
jgi:hypothetical protein